MTKDRDFKRHVRQRAEAAGLSYQATRQSMPGEERTDQRPAGRELHSLAVRWLNTHWRGDRTCIVCRADDLAIGHTLVRTQRSSGEHDAAEYLPVLCLTCGHTHLFDYAVVTGPPRT